MRQKLKSPLKLLVADNHRMVRAGIAAMLSLSSEKLPVSIDEAETTEEAINKSAANCYDVILMDCHLPGLGGPKATELILKKRPGTRVLALSNSDERSYVNWMMDAGAMGCILKNIEPDTLVTAIRTVLRGACFYSNEIALKLLEPAGARTELNRLTAREQEIFRLIIQGMIDREIASKLGIAKRTVDRHREKLRMKLGARNAVELVKAGMRIGIGIGDDRVGSNGLVFNSQSPHGLFDTNK